MSHLMRYVARRGLLQGSSAFHAQSCRSGGHAYMPLAGTHQCRYVYDQRRLDAFHTKADLGRSFWRNPFGRAVVLGCTSSLTFIGACFTYAVWYDKMLKRPDEEDLVRLVGLYVHQSIMFIVSKTLASLRVVTAVMDMEARGRSKLQQQEEALLFKENSTIERPVCFFGDSEFALWYSLQRDMLGYCSRCINAGFGGSRSCDLLRHAEPLCLEWRPRAVIIHTSGNDWDFRPPRFFHNVEDDEALATTVSGNILELVRMLRRQPDIEDVIVLLTPRRPTYSDAKWQYMCAVADKLLLELSRHGNHSPLARVVDLRNLAHSEDHYRADRVHLSVQGHAHKAVALRQSLGDEDQPESPETLRS